MYREERGAATPAIDCAPMGDRRADVVAAAGLAAVWALAALAAGPVGDFPLNDDWAYGLPVRGLVETGRLRFTDWQSMPLVTQVYWGGLFAWPAGFSFTALRLSTLVLGGATGIGVHFLLRRCGARPGVAALGGAALLASPIHLTLSHTFMTDIPFLAFAVWSVVLLMRGVDDDSIAAFAAGVLLAVAATLVRQIGMGIALAFVPALLLRGPLSRATVLRALVPIPLVAGAFFAFNAWLEAAGQVPSIYYAKAGSLGEALGHLVQGRVGALRNPIERTGWIALYTGMTALPLAIALAPAELRAFARSRQIVALGVAFAALVALALVRFGAGLPMSLPGNVLLDFGVGPRTVAGAPLPGVGASAWWAVNAVAILAALVVFALALSAGWRGVRKLLARTTLGDDWRVAFLGALVVVCFVPISFAYGAVFDRYYLSFAPWLLALGVCGADRARREAAGAPLAIGFVAAGITLATSVAAVHDYLAWNRVRWEAGRWLLRLDIAQEEIDGGFEWSNYLALANEEKWQGRGAAAVDRKTSPFAIAFVPGEGDEVLARFPVRSWLPRAATEVIAVRRAPPTEME